MLTDSRRNLIVDREILELCKYPESTLTENELKDVLQKFNLRDGLIVIGRLSYYLFNSDTKDRVGTAGIRDPQSGVLITQFALAYLANALITSGANDYKIKQIGEKDNLLLLINIYNNILIEPNPNEENIKASSMNNIASILVRLYGEQFDYQFNYVNLIARNLVIFLDILPTITSEHFEPLENIFIKETGLTFHEYFFLVFVVWVSSHKTGTFRKEMFAEANIPILQNLLTEQNIAKLLNILSTDYSGFRLEDTALNWDLEPVFTRTRFNPLHIYPIIKSDRPEIDPYIVPNTIALLKKGFGGLYWWFHRFFEKHNDHIKFRVYFGGVFEQYVGQILRNAYGADKVNPEIIYPKGKFIDWWVEQNNTIYLFEAKAYQFALTTKRTGDIDNLETEVRDKIVKSIKQIYKRLSEIEDFDELSYFRNKKIVSLVTFWEIPLASSHLYKNLIDTELKELEKEGMTGIKDTEIHFLNIEELELFSGAAKTIPIEDIFNDYADNYSEGFISVLGKKYGKSLNNKYLKKIYFDFFKPLDNLKK